MRVRRSTWSPLSLPLAAALVAGLSSILPAQGGGRPLFEWRGRVDREVRITIRGRDAWAQGIGQNENARRRAEVSGALPRSDGDVRVRLEDGRGIADVVQQPSYRNDYTAIVRIRDRSGGADFYRVSGYWQPDNNGSADGRGRDDDCRWAQDRRADDRNTANRRRDDRWCDDRRGDRDDNPGGGGDRTARSTLHWSGRVDDALEIRMQGDRIWYQTLSGKGTRDVNADILARGLPRDEGKLRIATREGRGNVSVVQQPSARNGYTAVIRVYDPRSGYGDYAFDVIWVPMYGRR